MRITEGFGSGVGVPNELVVIYGLGIGKGLIDPETGTDRPLHYCLTAVGTNLRYYGFGKANGHGFFPCDGDGDARLTEVVK